MYVPKHYAEERLDVLHDAIARAEFGTLVTFGSTGLNATHLPVLLDRAAGPSGSLRCHVARGNPQWRDHAPDVQALVMFLGPHAYISPNWYPSKQENGQVVPTWNYLAVHAYGPLRIFDDQDELRDHVTRLTQRQEATQAEPWQVNDAPADYVAGLLKGIVGLEIPIERLEGKWKMSQNRPLADREGAIDGLLASDAPAGHAVANVMSQLLP